MQAMDSVSHLRNTINSETMAVRQTVGEPGRQQSVIVKAADVETARAVQELTWIRATLNPDFDSDAGGLSTMCGHIHLTTSLTEWSQATWNLRSSTLDVQWFASEQVQAGGWIEMSFLSCNRCPDSPCSHLGRQSFSSKNTTFSQVFYLMDGMWNVDIKVPFTAAPIAEVLAANCRLQMVDRVEKSIS